MAAELCRFCIKEIALCEMETFSKSGDFDYLLASVSH